MQPGRFAAWPAVREAWQRLKGARRAYVYMSLTVAVVGGLVGVAVSGLLPPAPVETVTLESGEVVRVVSRGPRLSLDALGPSFTAGRDTAYPWVGQLATAAVSALFAGAFAAYALRRAVGLDVRYGMLAEHVRHFPTFMLYGLAALAAGYALGPVAGGAVALLAVLLGSVAFAFAQLFVVDRDAGPVEALRGSLAVVSRNLGQTLLLLLSGGAAVLLASVPLLLASLWAPPAVALAIGLVTQLAIMLLTALFSIAQACAFRDAVGVHTAGEALPLDGSSGSRTLSSGA